MKTEQVHNSALTVRTVTGQDFGDAQQSKPVSPQAFAIALRVLYQNWRQGTVACKGRADVARSGKKPWKQKGTGRARAGDAASPLWRGGGVIHGPQPRVRTLKIGKKVRQNVFNALLHKYTDLGRIIEIDGLNIVEKPSTKQAVHVLKNMDSLKKKVILFVKPDNTVTHLSFANIKNVHVMYFDQPNVYALANAHQWVYLKQDADNFKKMVQQWL